MRPCYTAAPGRCGVATEVLAVSIKPNNRNMADTAGVGQADQPEPHLAGEIVGLYPPVHPGLVFRQQLHDGLVETKCHRSKLHVAEPAERRRWALIAGATLGSLVPLVGLAAYLVRSRSTGKAQHAASH
jgi:hypothetical protein